MMKKLLNLVLIVIFTSTFFLGCSNINKPSAENNIIGLANTNDGTEQNIPFKCVYSGFLINYTNKIEQGFLPRKDIIFDTKEKWEAFQKEYLHDNAAINYIFNYPIDFSKQSLIYHPMVSAKQGVYSTASKVTKITKQNNELKYDIEDMNISVSSLKDTDFLFVSIIAVDKEYLKNIKK
ncbi:hypothetical protein HMPREF1982_01379 [Clostridiales bacterium oral taxon 876 str. F0540]|nr:hypothetical protein HMPREF1982_01379 [Clostridiales bacterium oral taxon 876 str. F0540]